jgi:hypothetical protein
MVHTTIQTHDEQVTLWANVAAVDFELKEDFLRLIEHGYRKEAIAVIEWALKKLEETPNEQK